MKKKIISAITSIFAAAALVTASLPSSEYGKMSVEAAGTSTIANPMIWSDVPDNDVIRVGDTYYMVSTTMFFNPGAPIMKSKDLVSWEICSYVYDILADGDVQNLKNGKHDYSHGQWATSLRYHDGNFYIFFGSYGTGKSYIYKTNDIENGKWTRSEINGMYHDASLLFDDDGRNYLVYGGGGEIKIKELNAEMTDFKWGGADKTLFKTGLDGLAGEGSHIQKIDGWYYVFVIAWPSGHGRLELCYRSKDLLGNYEGKTILDNSGAAQGGIVDTPDGKWYGLVFQDHGAVGRIPVLVPVTWQDSWPMMGVNGKVPATFEMDTDYKGTFLAKDDNFNYTSNKLALEWQWNHNPDNTAWSVTEREGYLRLTNKTLASSIIHARNTLTQRTEGPACSSVIKLDTKGMKPGDYAGLSAFQYKYGNVGVYVADNGSKKIYMAENAGYGGDNILESRDKIVEETNLNGDEIYLKEEFLFNTVDANMSISNNIDKVNFFYSYDGSSWTKIGSELSMSYDLKMFTGYRSAIYSYATKTTGGYADIDFFDYERADWNTPTVIEPDENGWYFHHSFENELCGWVQRGGTTIKSSSDEHYSDNGKNSLYISERTDSWNAAQYSIGRAFKAGETYSFSANVKYTDGADTEVFKFTMEYTDSDGEAHWDEIASVTVPKGEWAQLANPEFKIPEGASKISIYVETIDSTIDYYIDEVIGAVGGTKIEGAGVPDIVLKFTYGDLNDDGIINVFDVILAKRGVLAGKFDSPQAAAAADVDENGEVNDNDILTLQRYIVNHITEFLPPPALN